MGDGSYCQQLGTVEITGSILVMTSCETDGSERWHGTMQLIQKRTSGAVIMKINIEMFIISAS